MTKYLKRGTKAARDRMAHARAAKQAKQRESQQVFAEPIVQDATELDDASRKIKERTHAVDKTVHELAKYCEMLLNASSTDDVELTQAILGRINERHSDIRTAMFDVRRIIEESSKD